MKYASLFLLAVLLSACSNTPGSTGPSALTGDGSSRVGLLGAPPYSSIGPGQGTGNPIANANSCPTAGPMVHANQNNGKLDVSIPLTFAFPAGWLKVEWVLLSNARQVVATGSTYPQDVQGGRFFVFYPKNGGTYYVQAQVTYAGNCVGLVGETQVGFNKTPDNPEPVV